MRDDLSLELASNPSVRTPGSMQPSSRHETVLTGTEWMVDATGCDPASLQDAPLLERLMGELVVDLDLHVVANPLVHKFPGPGGVTLLYLLSESHLAAHTYPEFATATFNLYCCRSRDPWDWDERLRFVLSASNVCVRKFDRGNITSQTNGGDR